MARESGTSMSEEGAPGNRELTGNFLILGLVLSLVLGLYERRGNLLDLLLALLLGLGRDARTGTTSLGFLCDLGGRVRVGGTLASSLGGSLFGSGSGGGIRALGSGIARSAGTVVATDKIADLEVVSLQKTFEALVTVHSRDQRTVISNEYATARRWSFSSDGFV